MAKKLRFSLVGIASICVVAATVVVDVMFDTDGIVVDVDDVDVGSTVISLSYNTDNIGGGAVPWVAVWFNDESAGGKRISTLNAGIMVLVGMRNNLMNTRFLSSNDCYPSSSSFLITYIYSSYCLVILFMFSTCYLCSV